MEPEDIARQHAAFFGSYVGFLIVSSLVGLLLAFFNKIKAMMQYPALRVIVEPWDFISKGVSSDEILGLRDPIKDAEELMNQDRQRYDENSDFAFDNEHNENLRNRKFKKKQQERKGTKDEGIDMDFHF